MGTEITAGLPASLTAIGLYSGIISVVGIACCSLVSVCERRLRFEDKRSSPAPQVNSAAPAAGKIRPVETDQLRADFLSRN